MGLTAQHLSVSFKFLFLLLNGLKMVSLPGA